MNNKKDKWTILMDEIKNKEVGEFHCPYCDQTFFEKKKLDGHIWWCSQT